MNAKEFGIIANKIKRVFVYYGFDFSVPLLFNDYNLKIDRNIESCMGYNILHNEFWFDINVTDSSTVEGKLYQNIDNRIQSIVAEKYSAIVDYPIWLFDVLHEIGHHQTLIKTNMFRNKEFNAFFHREEMRYQKEINIILSETDTTETLALTNTISRLYRNKYVEKLADDWAIKQLQKSKAFFDKLIKEV